MHITIKTTLLTILSCILILPESFTEVSTQNFNLSGIGTFTIRKRGNTSMYVAINESFTDWERWQFRYNQCNPDENLNLSPITIKSNETIPDNKVKPIVVYTGSPKHNCFFLSIVYKVEEVEMEAVSIIPLPECQTTVTHITGAGEELKFSSYFRRALLMFSKSEVNEPQSLHKLDDKKFQMEISMEFMDENQNEMPSTELHVLVEAKPPGIVAENPIFKPLEDVIPSLKKEIVAEASGKTERALKYKALERKCLAATKNFTRVASQYKDFGSYKERIKSLQAIVDGINGTTNQEFLAKVELLQEQYHILIHGALNDTILELESKLRKLKEQKRYLVNTLKDFESDLEVRDMLFKTYGKILMLTKALTNAKKGRSPEVKMTLEGKLKSLMNPLKKYKVGIPGQPPYPFQEYNGPDEVHEQLARLQRERLIILEYRRVQDRFCKEFQDFQKHVPYGYVPIVLPFQISWFFPITGGFYMYNGSDPIPKCKRRKHSIVFEKPIQITTEQLAVFQSIPSLNKLRMEVKNGRKLSNDILNFEDNLRVDQMIPVLADDVNVKRTVLYVNKTPVYLSDDAIHAVAKRRNDTEHPIVAKIGDEITSSGGRLDVINGIITSVFFTGKLIALRYNLQ